MSDIFQVGEVAIYIGSCALYAQHECQILGPMKYWADPGPSISGDHVGACLAYLVRFADGLEVNCKAISLKKKPPAGTLSAGSWEGTCFRPTTRAAAE